MKFHKTIYFLFAVFFMMTKVGMAFNLHYCGERLANVSTIFGHKGCGMEMMMEELPGCEDNEQMQEMSCCSDEVLLIQNHDENPITDSAKITPAQLSAILTSAIVLNLLPVEDISVVLPSNFDYHSHAPPLYALYCQFTFYG